MVRYLHEKKYNVLNVWPETHARVIALARTKSHELTWGEHKKESMDVVVNRLLDYYHEHNRDKGVESNDS